MSFVSDAGSRRASAFSSTIAWPLAVSCNTYAAAATAGAGEVAARPGAVAAGAAGTAAAVAANPATHEETKREHEGKREKDVNYSGCGTRHRVNTD